MHISRRSLLALTAGAACATLVNGQAPQPKPGTGQSKLSTADLPTSIGGKNLKQWIAEIKSPDPSRRENAIRTVPLLKNAEEAIPALLDRVARDPDTSPRVAAVMVLGAIYIPPDNVSEIVKTLKDRLVGLNQDKQTIIR